MKENEREGDDQPICLPLIISSNRLVDDIAIKGRISTEHVIRKLERPCIETAGARCCFLAGFWRNNSGIPELDIPSAYTENLDRSYNSRHKNTSFIVKLAYNFTL